MAFLNRKNVALVLSDPITGTLPIQMNGGSVDEEMVGKF